MVSPEKVNHVSYEENIGHFEDHYDPQVNEMAASNAFFGHLQQEGENAQYFNPEIRWLASKFSF